MQRRYSGDRQGMAEGFETLAALLVAANSPALEWAAELFGLAEALREAVGAPLPPVEQADYQEAVSALRKEFDAQLGGLNAGEAFAAAWQSGRARATAPLETLLELVPVAGASAPWA